jgi:hypothetical protein
MFLECDHFNYSFREICERCSASKKEAKAIISTNGLPTRPGDWKCAKCNGV